MITCSDQSLRKRDSDAIARGFFLCSGGLQHGSRRSANKIVGILLLTASFLPNINHMKLL